MKRKLELTWVGKEERPRLEPRLLVEEDRWGDEGAAPNLLIQGDNLLALKALEAEYANSVKCVYIDPPFNTGAALPNYQDGLEHSTWLNLMNSRIELIYKLLSKSGSIFVHLDDNEADYAKILLDEIFGRTNFVSRITVSARSPSAFSTVNPGVFKASEYLLWYAKDKEFFDERTIRVRRDPDYAYNKWLENPDDPPESWRLSSLLPVYAAQPKPRSKHPKSLIEHFNGFMVEHAASGDRGSEARVSFSR